MARKTYKRRRTRKRATTKRYRRKRTYRKKAKTSTGRLWKYVKKATKSEVKRCDALYPPNWTFTNVSPTGTNAQLFLPQSRFLFTLRFANNGESMEDSYASYDPWTYTAKWRFWNPYQLKFHIAKGELSNQRIGDKVFAKYINFKIQFHCSNNDNHPYGAALYFVSIKRSVHAAYTSQGIMDSIWDGISNFCRDAHAGEIYDSTISDTQYESFRLYMNRSFYQRRRKYLKGIKIRKLHSTQVQRWDLEFPSYVTTSASNGRLQITGHTDTETNIFTTVGFPDNNNHLSLPEQTIMPENTFSRYMKQQRCIDKNYNILVPINKEWKYTAGAESSSGNTATEGLEEYKYYLIALSSDYHKDIDVSESGYADCRYFVSGELLYTDK